MLLPSIAQAQITADDVVLAMDDEQFQQALGSCFTADDRPEQLTLTLVVGPDGSASLMEPPASVTDDELACATLAAAYLEFPATGSSFAITVTVPVLDVVAKPAQKKLTLKPIEKKPFEIKTLVPPPGGSNVVLAAPAATVHFENDDAWRLEYAKGKKKFIGGIVTMGAGFQVLLMPGIAFLMTIPIMCDTSMTSFQGYAICRTWVGAGITMALLGTVAISIGIALLNQGRKIRTKAMASRPIVSLGPTPGNSGATLEISWHF